MTTKYIDWSRGNQWINLETTLKNKHRYFTSQRSKIVNAKITLKHKYWYFASQRSKIVNAKTQVFFLWWSFGNIVSTSGIFFNVISRNACKSHFSFSNWLMFICGHCIMLNLLLIGRCYLCVVTVEYSLKIMKRSRSRKWTRTRRGNSKNEIFDMVERCKDKDQLFFSIKRGGGR